MSEPAFYRALLVGFATLAAVIFAALLFISAPYGRHGREGFGPSIDATLGWVVMESPSALGMPLLFALGGQNHGAAGVTFLLLWEAHYLHRAFVFPLRRRGRSGRMPALVAAMAFTFNVANVYLNGRWLYHLGPLRGPDWLGDPRFVLGALLFVLGYAINLHADEVLLRLRRPGEKGYKIPQGGLYRWVSCPNYLGEVLEWCGFAICAWSPAAAVFALWTAANLVPRAISHHRWYKERFADYPKERRAILPFL